MMRKDPTQELRDVVTRIGALAPEQQDRVLEASVPFDDGAGLTAPQWNTLLDIVEHR